MNKNLSIDRAALEAAIHWFEQFVADHSNDQPFESFKDNRFLNKSEEYKSKLQIIEHEKILSANWTEHDIGTGKISATMISAVQHCDNLVAYQQIKHFEKTVEKSRTEAERILYDIYYGTDTERAFYNATKLFGAKYDIISYLFFLKDDTRFLPIRPRFFDKTFEFLGLNFKTKRRCSWENYQTFTQIVGSIRTELESYFGFYVRLIDAHSFLWLFTWEVLIKGNPPFEKPKKKETIQPVAVRIGQSEFRKQLRNVWDDKCSVTQCSKTDLLIASHIKPWRACNKDNEWLNPYNGLLLTPNLDRAFDQGYITFENTGKILISKDLSAEDCEKLGISNTMALQFVKEQHKPFLQYHREFIFKA